MTTNGILENPPNELRRPREKQTDHVLPFISIFSPDNPPETFIKTFLF